MASYETYKHHGRKVWVQKRLKGKHRAHCLCFNCEKFLPNKDYYVPEIEGRPDDSAQNTLLV